MTQQTHAQFIILATISAISATLSLTGSSLILCHVIGDLKAKVHHRTLFLLSIGDICLSTLNVIHPFVVPTDDAPFPSVVGNQTSCSVISFLVSVLTGWVAVYSAFISINFCFQIHFGWSEEKIARRVERAVHIAAALTAMILQTVALATQSINYWEFGGICFLVEYPNGCSTNVGRGDDVSSIDDGNTTTDPHRTEPDVGDAVPCERGGGTAKTLGRVAISLLCCLSCAGFLATFLVYRKVSKTLHQSAKHNFKEQTGVEDDCDSDGRCDVGTNHAVHFTSKHSSQHNDGQHDKQHDNQHDKQHEKHPRDSSAEETDGQEHDAQIHGVSSSSKSLASNWQNDCQRQSSTLTVTKARLNMDERHQQRIREVSWQCIMYALVYANLFIWPLLCQIMHELVDANGDETTLQRFPFQIAMYTLFPLQGWFNFLVFISPRYRLWRTALPDESRWYVFRCAVGKRNPPSKSERRPIQHAQVSQPRRNRSTESHGSHSNAVRVGMTGLSNTDINSNDVVRTRWRGDDSHGSVLSHDQSGRSRCGNHSNCSHDNPTTNENAGSASHSQTSSTGEAQHGEIAAEDDPSIAPVIHFAQSRGDPVCSSSKGVSGDR